MTRLSLLIVISAASLWAQGTVTVFGTGTDTSSSFMPGVHPDAAVEPASQILEAVRSLIDRQDLDQAKDELHEAIKKYPEEPAFYDFLGVVEAQQGDDRAAELSFKHATQLDSHLRSAYLNLGHLYQDQARGLSRPDSFKKAITVYRELLSFDPANSEANYQSAVVLMQLGDYGSSLQFLAHVPAVIQGRPNVLSVRCSDYAGNKNRPETELCVRHLVTCRSLSETDVLEILPLLESAHFDNLQVELLEGLAARELASQGALIQLAKIYERRGSLSQAREMLENAAQKQPDSVGLLTELANIAEHQHDYRGALGYLAHARDLEPNNASIHYLFGVVCIEDNVPKEAYDSLKTAVRLDPGNPYYNLAFGLVALNEEPAEAIAAFQRYCDSKPRDPRGHFALGVAYFYKGDYELARRELGSSTAHPETAAGAHFFLSQTYQKEGRFDEAEKELEKATEADPKYADAEAELGKIRLRAGKYKMAEQALQRAVAIEPDNYTAHFNLMLLYRRTNDSRIGVETQRFIKIRDEDSEHSIERLRRILIQRP